MKNQNPTEYIQKCFKAISQELKAEEKGINNRRLLEICGDYNLFGSDDKTGEMSDPHHCHEIAEGAVNFLIKEKYARELLAATEPAKACREVIKPLAERLPTQTWRSNEQVLRQQFSTPPAIAYLVAYLLNIKPGEKVLEPSAGTGSLAVWASGGAGSYAESVKLHVNEIDARRNMILQSLGYHPTAYNAEFIHDYLPPELNFDCLMMNPPFSSSGGRTGTNSSKFGFRHVESAFERLSCGGKFSVILGDVALLDSRMGNEFWRKLSDRIRLKAVFKIAGREYYKNGTSVNVNVFLGEKLNEERKTDWNRQRDEMRIVAAKTVEEAFNAAQNLNLRLNQ